LPEPNLRQKQVLFLLNSSELKPKEKWLESSRSNFFFYCLRPCLIEKHKFNRELSSRFWVPIIKPYLLLFVRNYAKNLESALKCCAKSCLLLVWLIVFYLIKKWYKNRGKKKF
jgi:hypothetical protein